MSAMSVYELPIESPVSLELRLWTTIGIGDLTGSRQGNALPFGGLLYVGNDFCRILAPPYPVFGMISPLTHYSREGGCPYIPQYLAKRRGLFEYGMVELLAVENDFLARILASFYPGPLAVAHNSCNRASSAGVSSHMGSERYSTSEMIFPEVWYHLGITHSNCPLPPAPPPPLPHDIPAAVPPVPPTLQADPVPVPRMSQQEEARLARGFDRQIKRFVCEAQRTKSPPSPLPVQPKAVRSSRLPSTRSRPILTCGTTTIPILFVAAVVSISEHFTNDAMELSTNVRLGLFPEGTRSEHA
ncbi:hypothetical protein B0H14DRAFT_2621167 [Mycena olivaceomarginata]|nr:hypothetical protein B0H14DRAFT_2621167 [Mycena olivaceomarginata]